MHTYYVYTFFSQAVPVSLLLLSTGQVVHQSLADGQIIWATVVVELLMPFLHHTTLAAAATSAAAASAAATQNVTCRYKISYQHTTLIAIT